MHRGDVFLWHDGDMKKTIHRPYTPSAEDSFGVNLYSSLEKTTDGFCLFIWVYSSFFHKKGARGQKHTTLYEFDKNAKTFRYGPVNEAVWLQMNRDGIERDATYEYVRIFKAHTGRIPVIHTKRV